MARDIVAMEEKIKRKRRVKLAVTIVGIAVAALLVALMLVTYGYIVTGRFAMGTTINGINCSGKTVDETADAIEKKILKKKVNITQDGENCLRAI